MRSLATYRAQVRPFQVRVEGSVTPISEAIDRASTALSSNDTGSVAEAADIPTTEREISSFVSIAKCVLRLEAQGLTLEQAAALIRAPETSSKARLCGVFGEARDMCRELGSFRHFLLRISTTGVYEKNKQYGFLINGER